MLRSIPLLAVLLLGLPPANARAADGYERSLNDLEECPSLRRCCLPDEGGCVHPGAARLLLAGSGGALLGGGTATFLSAGDSLGAGDPMGQLIGAGLIGLIGSGLGAIFSVLSPRGELVVPDRASRPTLRLGLSPGGTSTLDARSPYGLSLSLDPSFRLAEPLEIRPHASIKVDLGTTQEVDPRPQNSDPIAGHDSTFPVALNAWQLKITGGAEVALALPYPVLPKRPAFLGRVELRYRPMWELRRRVLHLGDDGRQQAIEHNALYPATFGLRWHVSPRQRITVYAGPRIDWIAFTDPGEKELRRGRPNPGSLHAEAWWEVDVPLTPLDARATHVAGRLTVGYVHSNLDGVGFDIGAVVGYFGPVIVSFDLRVRKLGSPVAVQLTAGAKIGASGGPFVELGLVTPELGRKRGGS